MSIRRECSRPPAGKETPAVLAVVEKLLIEVSNGDWRCVLGIEVRDRQRMRGE
jgi:hypothetical protein